MNSTVTTEDNSAEVIVLESSRDASIDDALEKIPLPSAESETAAVSSILTLEVCESDKNGDQPNADAANTSKSPISTNPDESQPLFKVTFRDESIARQYSEQVKQYLHTLVLSKSAPSAASDSSSLVLEVWDDWISPKSQDTCMESEDSQDSACNLLFTIDKQPMPKDDLDIPTYGKKYEKVYQKPSSDLTECTKVEGHVQKLSCFNCSGNHNLRDCTEPRNQANINKNRKDFNAKSNAKATRYHLEVSQRFGHLVPGRLSKDLRKALGLKDNQLPRHIYRMRILGYPPGWLEEARLQHSGLSLFNSDGVAEIDPNEEPGEIIIDPSDKDQYDIKKIYDFPGFNVPPPPGTRDDYQQHWAPQMQAVHSKETMLSMLQCKKVEAGYKRKKLKVSGGLPTPPDSQTIPSEMDIEDVDECVVESVPVNGHFLPPLPKDTPPKLPEPPLPVPPATSEDSDGHSQEPLSPNSPHNESTAPSSRGNSPSLSDLECMKKRLLVELEDSSSQSNPETPTKAEPASVRANRNATTIVGELTPQTSRSSAVATNPLNTSRGSVKSLDLGTPLLQSTSPYSKLPSSEKFSKNICDVINFENLPDSTGKYEQMTGIIQKVRDTLSKIHQQSQ